MNQSSAQIVEMCRNPSHWKNLKKKIGEQSETFQNMGTHISSQDGTTNLLSFILEISEPPTTIAVALLLALQCDALPAESIGVFANVCETFFTHALKNHIQSAGREGSVVKDLYNLKDYTK